MERLLAEQAYVKVVREVGKLSQSNFEENRKMYLYEDKVTTRYRTFAIESIIDMSYRFIGNAGGMLYLHTDKGVFPYIVNSSPEIFVHTFKDYKNLL